MHCYYCKQIFVFDVPHCLDPRETQQAQTTFCYESVLLWPMIAPSSLITMSTESVWCTRTRLHVEQSKHLKKEPLTCHLPTTSANTAITERKNGMRSLRLSDLHLALWFGQVHNCRWCNLHTHAWSVGCLYCDTDYSWTNSGHSNVHEEFSLRRAFPTEPGPDISSGWCWNGFWLLKCSS